MPDSGDWTLDALCERDAAGRYPLLLDLLEQCAAAAYQLSDDLGARYFTHSAEARESVGA